MSAAAVHWLVGALILAAAIALFFVMVRTWRTRSARQSAVVSRGVMPDGLGAPAAAWAGQYVATTGADAPLERVSADGLGYRGRGGIAIHGDGLVIRIAGTADRWIPGTDLRGVDRATWAIDRAVEAGGLTRLRWRATGAAGATDLDSYFRFPDGDSDVLAAVRDLVAAQQSAAPDTTNDSHSASGGEH